LLETKTLGPVLFSRNQISGRVTELAEEISTDFREVEEVTLLVVLKGAAMFGADLARRMSIRVRMDYLPATSYRGTWSSGAVSIGPLRPADVFERNVVIVEDVCDTGATLSALHRHVQELGPARLDVCSLFDKTRVRGTSPPVPVRYIGFHIPDRFIVGYGMDLEEAYRHLPDVHLLE